MVARRLWRAVLVVRRRLWLGALRGMSMAGARRTRELTRLHGGGGRREGEHDQQGAEPLHHWIEYTLPVSTALELGCSATAAHRQMVSRQSERRFPEYSRKGAVVRSPEESS